MRDRRGIGSGQRSVRASRRPPPLSKFWSWLLLASRHGRAAALVTLLPEQHSGGAPDRLRGRMCRSRPHRSHRNNDTMAVPQ